MNAKIIESTVAVSMACYHFGSDPKMTFRSARKLLADIPFAEKILEIAADIDEMAVQQANDARSLSRSLAEYASRLDANPCAPLCNPISGSIVQQMTERGAKITAQRSFLLTMIRMAMNEEVELAVSGALLAVGKNTLLLVSQTGLSGFVDRPQTTYLTSPLLRGAAEKKAEAAK